MLDLANLEWWQAVVGIFVALGLSPAPWVLGLALNRLQFTATARADYATRAAEKDAAHAAEVANLKASKEQIVQQLIEHHEALRQTDRERYAELGASRDGWRETAEEQRLAREAAEQRAIEIGTEAAKIAGFAFENIEREGQA